VSDGWVPAHRKVFETDHWLAPSKRDPASRLHAWLDLCQMATHQPRETALSGVLKRGELVVSVRTMGRRWKWSKSRVQRFASDLEARTAIEPVRGTPDGTVYRVVAYDTYAVGEKATRDTQRDTERDTSGTEAGQEQAQKHTRRTEYTPSFEVVWGTHRKGSKPKAFVEYKRAVPKKVTHDALLDCLQSYVERELTDKFHGHDLFRWMRDEHWHAYERTDGPVQPASGGGFYVGG